MANPNNIPILTSVNEEEWAALKEQSICIEVSMVIDGEEFRQGIAVKPEEYESHGDCQSHIKGMLKQIGWTFANVIIHKKLGIS